MSLIVVTKKVNLKINFGLYYMSHLAFFMVNCIMLIVATIKECQFFLSFCS